MPRGGNTNARGYGARHRAARAAMKLTVAAGHACCSICGGPISPHEPWDADHTDDRQGYRGPAHRACNRRTGAIKGNRARGQVRAVVKRWRL